MSLSFHQWRAGQRRKFEDDFLGLKKSAVQTGKRPILQRRFRFLRWRRRSHLMMLGLAGLALAGVAWDPSALLGDSNSSNAVRTIRGAATIVDGDTLRIAGESIRLHGIDAPELRQTCADGWYAGDAARRTLASLVAAGAPQCERITTDRYGRTVAVCRVNGEDVGAAMVKQGVAWAYSRYSWRYLAEETLARFEGIGVHAHDCQNPMDWRAQHRGGQK